ncbi:hypothetical protein [Tuberibacillus sp. Marseille-P3662]|uniref:hypothetical protein n=1 Tax=Tuberibacillus sp. Marseille-P3662 TaxID=1965358 RepID=UPI000A1CABA6|nr:hypothetical protein [Tuberibacillus sp. Marseille-P3662]
MAKNNEWKHSKDKDAEPSIAPGMDDQEELEADASKKEVAKGASTRVTHLSYDEVGPSDEE